MSRNKSINWLTTRPKGLETDFKHLPDKHSRPQVYGPVNNNGVMTFVYYYMYGTEGKKRPATWLEIQAAFNAPNWPRFYRKGQNLVFDSRDAAFADGDRGRSRVRQGAGPSTAPSPHNRPPASQSRSPQPKIRDGRVNSWTVPVQSLQNSLPSGSNPLAPPRRSTFH